MTGVVHDSAPRIVSGRQQASKIDPHVTTSFNNGSSHRRASSRHSSVTSARRHQHQERSSRPVSVRSDSLTARYHNERDMNERGRIPRPHRSASHYDGVYHPHEMQGNGYNSSM